MGNVLIIIDTCLSAAYIVEFLILFYLSVKKCFWREGKNKVKLFLMTLITSPGSVIFVSASVLMLAGIILFPGAEDAILAIDTFSVETIIYLSLMAVLYVALSILFARLNAKWLGLEIKEPMIFLYLTFNTFFLTSSMEAANGETFSVPEAGYVFDIIKTVILCSVVLAFYFMDVQVLAGLARVKAKVNWKVFLFPPTIFIVVYTIFMTVFTPKMSGTDYMPFLLSEFFSTVILFLLIWAYHVIMKNISATEDAVKAKDEAVKAEEEAVKAKEEVKTLSVEVMEALAHTIDAKDEYTRGHSVRVAKYSEMLAEKLGRPAEECESVYYMALLHDIGKIGVPNEIINSPTRLTDDQYAVIKTHPGVGFDILAEIKSRPDLSTGARWHHERYDGKGYPDGKKGTEIPFAARIIAVADSYDAMTSNRSYRRYMAQADVRSELEKNSGTQFDPEIAQAMIALIDEDKDYVMHE